MQPNRLAIVGIVAFMCCCVGCDTIHGVSRTLPLDTLPSAEAVEQAIHATPGVTEVTRRDIPPTEGWSPSKGTIHDTGFAQFACRDEASAFAVVEPKDTNQAGKQLYVSCIWMNHVPTEGELSNARGLIDRLCNSLHQRVPSIPASSSSEDKFVGIARH